MTRENRTLANRLWRWSLVAGAGALVLVAVTGRAEVATNLLAADTVMPQDRPTTDGFTNNVSVSLPTMSSLQYQAVQGHSYELQYAYSNNPATNFAAVIVSGNYGGPVVVTFPVPFDQLTINEQPVTLRIRSQ